MALPNNDISLSQVNVELSRPATQTIDLNEAPVRTLAGVGGSGTVISMNDLRGKSALSPNPYNITVGLTPTGQIGPYNLYDNRGPQYSPAGLNVINWTLPSSVNIVTFPTASAQFPQSEAFNVPNQFAPTDIINMTVNGNIRGRGGRGGPGNDGPGDPASPALRVQRPVNITNNATIAGGGGGGGGGRPGSKTRPSKQGGPQTRAGGAGGGGAGAAVGSAGTAGPGSFPIAADPGTQTDGGAGAGINPLPTAPPNVGLVQAIAGGSGGPAGTAGSPSPIQPGGAAGSYAVGNPFINWVVTGTRIGPAA